MRTAPEGRDPRLAGEYRRVCRSPWRPSKSFSGNRMRVQVPPSAPTFSSTVLAISRAEDFGCQVSGAGMALTFPELWLLDDLTLSLKLRRA